MWLAACLGMAVAGVGLVWLVCWWLGLCPLCGNLAGYHAEVCPLFDPGQSA